jgi:diguanylate cyclase (GGDEF)-like protein/PAS domain S-box-containing protein
VDNSPGGGAPRFPLQQLSLQDLRDVLDGCYDAIFVHDAQGAILEVNQRMLEMYGVTREQALAMDIGRDYSSPDSPVASLPGIWEAVLAGESRLFEWTARRPADGSAFDVEVYLTRIELGGEPVIMANVRDLSERRASQARLRTLTRIVEQSPASIMVTDHQGRIEYVNPRFTELSGYTLDEVRGRNPSLLSSGRLPPEHFAEMWSDLKAGRVWRGTFANKAKNGREYWEAASVSAVEDDRGRLLHYVSVAEDVTERRRQEERIRRLALHDHLTGLPNRALLMDRLEQTVERVRRTARPAAVLFIDLDGFKAVNDRFGHQAGDRVLQEMARRINDAVRSMDTAARLGGDEFAVIMQDAPGAEQALALARRIHARLNEPLSGETLPEVTLGASIGVALCPNSGLDVDALLAAADRAMYQVKSTSAGGVGLYEGGT